MSDIFKQVIQEYVDQYAANDPVFKVHFEKPDKTIDKCCQYILTEVKASGREGFADDEIYSMARMYYQLDNVNIDDKLNANVVVNRPIAKAEPKPTPKAATKKATPPVQPNNQLNLLFE